MADLRPRISVKYLDRAAVIAFTDEKILEEKDIHDIQQSIMSVIDQAEHINLILDFSNVKFLSSAVLGLLLRISKKIYEQEGKLKLCGINPKIYEIFRITKLINIFDICDDVDSAVKQLQ